MKISIIVPVYNVESKYLDKCFASLRNQNYVDAEYIIVDDGSEKSTAMKCDEFGKTEKRALIIHQENKGLAGARNTGIKASSGELLLFLDSDDWFVESNTISKVVEICTRDYNDIYFFEHKHNQLIIENKYLGKMKDDYSVNQLKSVIIRKDSIGTNLQIASAWAKVFRKAFIVNHGVLFDEQLRRTQDRVFMLSLLDKNPQFDNYNTVIMCFNTENENSLSRKFDKQNIEFLQLYYDRIKEYVVKSKIPELISDADYLYLLLYFEICAHTFFHKNNKDSFAIKKQEFTDFSKEYLKGANLSNLDRDIKGLERKALYSASHNDYNMAFALLEINQQKNSIKKGIKELINVKKSIFGSTD